MSGRVLVTGGTGFVGRRLVRKWRDDGLDVYAPGRNLLDVAAGIFPETTVDLVVHLAGRTFVPDSWNEPANFYQVNAQGTVNVLDYCRRTTARMIYVSGYCYGIPESLPISETAPVKPNNAYAFSKFAGEEACRFFFSCFGTNVSILRPFNIYGPGQSTAFLLPRIVEQAIDPTSCEIVVEDDRPRRDFVHLDDVIAAITAVMETPQPGATYNVGSGVSYSVAELVEFVRAAANVTKPTVSRGNQRINDIPDVVADISSIRNAIGWRPSVSIEQGMQSLVADQLAARSGSVV